MKDQHHTFACLSLLTGYLFPNPDGGNGFSEMHELSEYMLGRPIFTHAFAVEGLLDEAKKSLVQQYPALQINTEGWEALSLDRRLSMMGTALRICLIELGHGRLKINSLVKGEE